MYIKTKRKANMNQQYFSWLLVVFVALSSVCPSVRAKNCAKVDACSCAFDDNSGTVDVSSIGSQSGTPLIDDAFAADNYAYSYNPCYPFSEGTCTNAAACQYDSANVLYYNIGDSQQVDWSYDGLNVIATYTADDGARQSIVTYVCDPSATTPQTTVNGETGTAVYSFQITSSAACPSGAPPGPTVTPDPFNPVIHVDASVSIGAGSVLTIIFFAVLVTYLVAGVVLNKFVRHRNGTEVVPNLNVWSALLLHIKEGFRFTFSKIRRREYQPI